MGYPLMSRACFYQYRLEDIGMNNPETKDSSVEMIKILFSVFMLLLLKEKSKVLVKLPRPTRKILVYGTYRKS